MEDGGRFFLNLARTTPTLPCARMTCANARDSLMWHTNQLRCCVAAHVAACVVLSVTSWITQVLCTLLICAIKEAPWLPSQMLALTAS